MIWLIILVVLAIVAFCMPTDYGIKDRLVCAGAVLAGGGIVCTIVLMFTTVVITQVSGGKTARWDISTVSDNQGMHGRFSIFGGTIDDQPVFYYYRQDGAARYLERTPAYDAIIYEDSESPYFTCKYKEPPYHFWLLLPFRPSNESCHDYEFHVPPGSISTRPLLDAQ